MERELKKRGGTVLIGTTVERRSGIRRPAQAIPRWNEGALEVLVSWAGLIAEHGTGRWECRGDSEGRLVQRAVEKNLCQDLRDRRRRRQGQLAHGLRRRESRAEKSWGIRPVRLDVSLPEFFTLPEIGRVGVTKQQECVKVRLGNHDQALTVDVFDIWVGKGASDRGYERVLRSSRVASGRIRGANSRATSRLG